MLVHTMKNNGVTRDICSMFWQTLPKSIHQVLCQKITQESTVKHQESLASDVTNRARLTFTYVSQLVSSEFTLRILTKKTWAPFPQVVYNETILLLPHN